jgi:putative glutamine amidotransferase
MAGPLIGITTSIAPAGTSPERAVLNGAYIQAVQRAGGVPVILPPQLEAEQLDSLLGLVDGVVLSGGGDVGPSLYTLEAAHPTVTGVSPERDRAEAAVIQRVLADQKPLFAICRGMQVLNVVLGGTLYQDIASTIGEEITHQQTDAGFGRGDVTHTVEVRSGTLLANLVGPGRIAVNSMHHQSLRALGSHLVVSARAQDGVIEAVEAPALGRFVLGVQWHPEELAELSDGARALFRGLVEAAANREPAPLKVTEVRPEAAGELRLPEQSRRLALGRL